MEIKVPGLHPKLADSVSAMRTELKARGIQADVQSGVRDEKTQNDLYAQGRTKPGEIITNAKAWESWHNYGIAVDFCFKTSTGGWTWNVPQARWDELGLIGEMFGLQWGGRWSKIKDPPHFQLKMPITVQEAKKIVLKDGIEAVWAKA